MRGTTRNESRHPRANDLLTLRSRLERAIAGLPEGSHVTFPVAALQAWLDQERTLEPDDPLVDMTVVEVAGRLGRSPSTVRGWCGSGALKGAYRLRGREWRVPRARLQEFLEHEATRREERKGAREADERVDIGAWRKVPR